jgi:proline dehydrogenase
LEEALDALAGLQAQGFDGILDILGEDVANEEEARQVLQAYSEAATGLAERKLQAYVSVKPTHLGLRISKDLALELYRELAAHCTQLGLFLRVEMEDHSTTEDTLALHAALRAEFDSVGIVIQSRLFRTEEDLLQLPAGSNIRMVKGIYLEPAAIAHTDPQPIRDAFAKQAIQCLKAGHRVSFATHDDDLARTLIQACAKASFPTDSWEFQVLMGVQRPLWNQWKQEGAKVRVYVPYGPSWRAYSIRRLKKNPQILGHIVRATLGLS